MKNKQALVVEGGAMRGVFASGVLDAFLEQEHQPYGAAFGVSAGASNLIGYLANQPKRSIDVITKMATTKEFFNIKRAISGGNLADVKWLWEQSKAQYPIDNKELYSSMPFYVAVTNIHNGQAEYHRITPINVDRVMEATAALPMIYKDTPCFDNSCYTDGGVADSIPVMEAYRQGYRDITVVLSRPLNFEMKPVKYPRLVKALFSKNPSLVQAMLLREKKYNASIEFIRNPPPGTKVRVIAPPSTYAVKRLTMDKDILWQGYEMGVEEGNKHLLALKNLSGLTSDNCHFCY
ncbi:patatin family protein [Vibrio makurazakiensis]|uniref:patatin-like phospholipase family protein n=1 Tax=Vibrio makurazakiensis TaxID=2910250 RepID=UPI003D139129